MSEEDTLALKRTCKVLDCPKGFISPKHEQQKPLEKQTSPCSREAWVRNLDLKIIER